jgi:hypothetical protein
MFTLEIDGKAVAITNADREQAEELFQSQDFKDDLVALTSDGRPLWNGTSPLTVRPASDEETEAFDDAMAEEEEDEGEEEKEDQDAEDEEDSVDVMFLVDIDEDEEEEEG